MRRERDREKEKKSQLKLYLQDFKRPTLLFLLHIDHNPKLSLLVLTIFKVLFLSPTSTPFFTLIILIFSISYLRYLLSWNLSSLHLQVRPINYTTVKFPSQSGQMNILVITTHSSNMEVLSSDTHSENVDKKKKKKISKLNIGTSKFLEFFLPL